MTKKIIGFAIFLGAIVSAFSANAQVVWGNNYNYSNYGVFGSPIYNNSFMYNSNPYGFYNYGYNYYPTVTYVPSYSGAVITGYNYLGNGGYGYYGYNRNCFYIGFC